MFRKSSVTTQVCGISDQPARQSKHGRAFAWSKVWPRGGSTPAVVLADQLLTAVTCRTLTANKLTSIQQTTATKTKEARYVINSELFFACCVTDNIRKLSWI